MKRKKIEDKRCEKYKKIKLAKFYYWMRFKKGFKIGDLKNGAEKFRKNLKFLRSF